MIREDLSEEGTFEQAMHRWGRGRAFLAEGRQFQSPEEGTSWHIEEAETHEAEMSKGKSGRDEIGEEGRGQTAKGFVFSPKGEGGPLVGLQYRLWHKVVYIAALQQVHCWMAQLEPSRCCHMEQVRESNTLD